MQSDILTIREVAEYLKLNEKTTYRLVSEGRHKLCRCQQHGYADGSSDGKGWEMICRDKSLALRSI